MTGRRDEPRRTRPLLPAAVALVGALGLVGGLGTQAYWSDVETVSGATVTSGSLDLRVEGVDTFTWSALSMANLAPGESTAESLTLSNTGTTPFTITVTGEAVTASASLRAAMRVSVGWEGAATTVSGTYPRSESCSGTLTYGPAALPASATTVLGPTTSVPPGETRTLCVLIAFDTSADNSTQQQSYAPTFRLTATQVQP